MAIFKVGDNVRVISTHHTDPDEKYPVIGATGFIVRRGAPDWDWVVVLPRHRHAPAFFGPHEYGFMSDELAPLTDPKADEFIESLKRLGREPAPREEEAFAKVRKLLEQSE